MESYAWCSHPVSLHKLADVKFLRIQKFLLIEIDSRFLNCIRLEIACRLCDDEELCPCSNLVLVMRTMLNRHMLGVHSPDLS